MTKTVKVDFNWGFVSTVNPQSGDICGEVFESYTVGINDIVKINYFPCFVEGDKAHCKVFFKNGNIQTIFNINRVYQEEQNNGKRKD